MKQEPNMVILSYFYHIKKKHFVLKCGLNVDSNDVPT